MSNLDREQYVKDMKLAVKEDEKKKIKMDFEQLEMKLRRRSLGNIRFETNNFCEKITCCRNDYFILAIFSPNNQYLMGRKSPNCNLLALKDVLFSVNRSQSQCNYQVHRGTIQVENVDGKDNA